MKNKHPPIFLMGFKHVGKSVIGKALALQLGTVFVDLDQEIESLFQQQHQTHRSCREIMQQLGQTEFRSFESLALETVLRNTSGVIALGGGTPMYETNQTLLKDRLLIHLEAPYEVVYKRIMAGGRPAFFPQNEDPDEFFLRLWQERESVYRRLATMTVQNNGSVADAVEQILQKI